MFEIVTLAEIKSWCKVTTTALDVFFETLRTAVTQVVETYIGHKVITRQFTDFQDGAGRHVLLLRHYPVYLELDSDDNPANVTLYDDTDREWTSDTQIDAEDFWVEPDTGRVTLYNDEWSFSSGIANVKAIYRAGYSRFLVQAGVNSWLDVKENDGAEVSVQVSEKRQTPTEWPGYDAEGLAEAVQTALNAASGLAGTYTVTYDHIYQKFKITASGITKLSLLWSTGTHAANSIGSLLGFDTSADDAEAGTTSYTADDAVTGVPADIRLAAQQVVLKLWEESKQGVSIQNVVKEVLQGGVNREWVKDWLPPVAVGALEKYRKFAV